MIRQNQMITLRNQVLNNLPGETEIATYAVFSKL